MTLLGQSLYQSNTQARTLFVLILVCCCAQCLGPDPPPAQRDSLGQQTAAPSRHLPSLVVAVPARMVPSPLLTPRAGVKAGAVLRHVCWTVRQTFLTRLLRAASLSTPTAAYPTLLQLLLATTALMPVLVAMHCQCVFGTDPSCRESPSSDGSSRSNKHVLLVGSQGPCDPCILVNN
jgi:hypothetical protein